MNRTLIIASYCKDEMKKAGRDVSFARMRAYIRVPKVERMRVTVRKNHFDICGLSVAPSSEARK